MASSGEYPKINGDIYYGPDANAPLVVTVEAGENVTAGNIIYIKQNDGKAYVGDTGTADDYRASGVALQTITSGSDVAIMVRGVYTTTSLTDGEVYYLGAAGAISTTRSSVEIGVAISTTQLTINIIQDDRDTVGTVKAWLGDFTGAGALTAFWVEGEGQVLSDAESPMNGQTIPDLNGSSGTEVFLRGGTASGGTGGTETHNHKWKRAEVTSGAAIDASVGASGSKAGAGYNSAGAAEDWTGTGTQLDAGAGDYTDKVSTLPTYYAVRFIIKIK